MPGCTQDRRRHALSVRSSLHVILYMLAVGPPRSVSTPEKPAERDSSRTSRRTLPSLLLWMTRPSCSVMLQNVQPPKQPRIVTIECFTVSKAGMPLLAYDGCGARANGRS